MKVTGLKWALWLLTVSKSERPNQTRASESVELQSHFAFGAGEVRCIEGPARVECVSGQIWITQTGSNQDVVLRPGEARMFTHPGLVVMEALTSAEVLCGAHKTSP